MEKYLRVAENSLEEAAKYLDLDFTPEWIEVESWEQLDRIESLRIRWSDVNRAHCVEANQNLDQPCQVWEYQKE